MSVIMRIVIGDGFEREAVEALRDHVHLGLGSWVQDVLLVRLDAAAGSGIHRVRVQAELPGGAAVDHLVQHRERHVAVDLALRHLRGRIVRRLGGGFSRGRPAQLR